MNTLPLEKTKASTMTMQQYITTSATNSSSTSEIPEPSEESLKAVRLAVDKRHEALKQTNSRNWQAQAASLDVKPPLPRRWYHWLGLKRKGKIDEV